MELPLIHLLAPFVLAAWVLVTAYLSVRLGRLYSRPQDAPLVRALGRGMLTTLLGAVFTGAATGLYLPTAIGGAPLDPAIGALAAAYLVAWGGGYAALGRLRHAAPVDESLRAAARWTIGLPIALVASATALIAATVLALPWLTPGGTLAAAMAPVVGAAPVVVSLGLLWSAIAFSWFALPFGERDASGRIRQLTLEQLRERWRSKPAQATAAPVPAEPEPASTERPSAQPRRAAQRE